MRGGEGREECVFESHPDHYTFMPKACIRVATSLPILPRPTIPRVFPSSSTPMYCAEMNRSDTEYINDKKGQGVGCQSVIPFSCPTALLSWSDNSEEYSYTNRDKVITAKRSMLGEGKGGFRDRSMLGEGKGGFRVRSMLGEGKGGFRGRSTLGEGKGGFRGRSMLGECLPGRGTYHGTRVFRSTDGVAPWSAGEREDLGYGYVTLRTQKLLTS